MTLFSCSTYPFLQNFRNITDDLFFNAFLFGFMNPENLKILQDTSIPLRVRQDPHISGTNLDVR
jgi:hypothetical protein